MQHDRSSLDDALALMRDLRTRCEWDAAQTHQSLRPYLLEEALEVDDAIRAENDTLLAEDVHKWLANVPEGATIHAVIRDLGSQRDPEPTLVGLRATWSEVR